MKVEEGKVVTLEYTITTEKGEIIESSAGRGEPLAFLFGKSGLIPGLDEGIRGMEQGEEKEFTLPPEQAFGTLDSGPTMALKKTQLPKGTEYKVGLMFEAELPGTGQQVIFAILEDRVNDITVRLIHPLAGKTIQIKAKIESIREASPEEIKAG